MEIEKYNVTAKLNKKEHKRGEMYYLLHGANTWVSENNLNFLNSLVVKKYNCSNWNELIKIEEWDKHMNQNVHIADIECYAAALDFKQEHFVDSSNGRFQVDIVEKHLTSDIYDNRFTPSFQLQDRRIATPITTVITGKIDPFSNPEITGDKCFPCNICNKRFATSSHLKGHQLTHTDDKPFNCDICDKRFKRSYALKRHQLIHTGDKPFICNICGKRCGQSYNLKRHQLTHTGDKPYTCDICNKRFTESSNLKGHQLIHTGYKPFSCNLCNKRFKTNSHLKTHQLTHTGDKPFLCNICGKRFGQISNLNNHQLTHNDEKLFICNICEKRFKQRFSLKRHQLRHTSDKKGL